MEVPAAASGSAGDSTLVTLLSKDATIVIYHSLSSGSSSSAPSASSTSPSSSTSQTPGPPNTAFYAPECKKIHSPGSHSGLVLALKEASQLNMVHDTTPGLFEASAADDAAKASFRLCCGLPESGGKEHFLFGM